jgi:hypothetical protein
MQKLVINSRGDEKVVYPSVAPMRTSFDRKPPLDAHEWFGEARRRQETRERVVPEYQYAKYEMESETPVIIGVTGDWHLGGSVNLDMLYRDIDLMATHPLVRGVFYMGDLTDSGFFNPLQDDNYLSFEEQRDWMMGILRHVGWDRALAFWKGNHDHKWETKMGGSKYQEIAERSGRPVFYGPAFVEMEINRIPYRLMGSHQLRGNSIYNNAHPAVRGHREVQGIDITMAGHTHKRGQLEQATREFNGSRKTLSLMSGTYQNGSSYGRDNGFGNQSEPEQGMWWLVLGHDKKRFKAMGSDDMIEFAEKYL